MATASKMQPAKWSFLPWPSLLVPFSRYQWYKEEKNRSQSSRLKYGQCEGRLDDMDASFHDQEMCCSLFVGAT